MPTSYTTATPTTGALRSGVSSTRRPLGRVRRSTGYFVAGMRMARDTTATLAGRAANPALRRPDRVHHFVDHRVVLPVRARDRDVENCRLGASDIDEDHRDQLVGGLQPGLVEVQA